jgi:dipeptidyl aminopeptidase/acylaminoacyl peptidase
MPDLIPLPVLFGNPERVSPSISPDGTQLAWIAPQDGVLNVWLAPVSIESGVDLAGARVVTDDADRGIRQFGWAHDGRHLLYLQDTGGDENWRLHDVDLQTMERRDLTPFDGVQTQIIAMERQLPSEILIGLNRDNPQLHDVYRVNLETGELTKEVDNPGVVSWIADAQMVIRAAVAPLPDGGFDLLVRDSADPESADSKWRTLLTVPAEDGMTTDVIAFSADGSSLLITSSAGAQTARLARIDVATGVTEVLAEDPEADVSGVRIHPDTREPQIVTVLKSRSEYRVLDPAVADDLAAIRALHPGDPVFEGADDSDAVWLVGFTNDTGPIPYYAFDRATKTARFLFEHRPDLSQYELAGMEPFSFTARDGLTVHGYLTFPAGVERAGLPTVLNVHGGPWARDVWGFDSHSQ